MREDGQGIVAVLNRLYAAERGHLLLRVPEIGTFADRREAAHLPTVRRMAEEVREHLLWLTDAAETCGGAIAPAAPPAAGGHLHYLSLRAVLPALIESSRRLVELYRAITGETAAGEDRHVAAVLNRIAGRHRVHLETLQAIAAELGVAATA